MKLRSKLWLLILASSVSSLVLFVGSVWIISIFTDGYTQSSLQQIGQQWTMEAEKQAAVSNNGDMERQIKELLDQYHAEHPLVHMDWISSNGDLQYATDQRQESYTYAEMLDRFVGMPAKLWAADDLVNMAFEWKLNEEKQYLVLSMSSAAMQGTQFFFYVREFWMFIYLILPLISFFIAPVIFSLILFFHINRRLIKLNRAMQVFDANGKRIVLDDQGKDEISQLNRHFDHMSDRIQKQVAHIQDQEQKRRTLIANLSHDLRTPLTMIQGYSETLHSGLYQNEEEKQAYTEIVMRRARYMNDLLEKLLEISKLDTQHERIHREKFNLSEHLRKLAADYIIILENRGMSFDIQIPDEPMMVTADPQLIERAVRNLIENAVQYGHAGKYLGLELRTVDTESIEISLTDYGPGIPAEKQNKIFERFYRGSDAREGEGLGIGLSIVSDIVKAHNGKVWMKSNHDEGTRFIIILPQI